AAPLPNAEREGTARELTPGHSERLASRRPRRSPSGSQAVPGPGVPLRFPYWAHTANSPPGRGRGSAQQGNALSEAARYGGPDARRGQGRGRVCRYAGRLRATGLQKSAGIPADSDLEYAGREVDSVRHSAGIEADSAGSF